MLVPITTLEKGVVVEEGLQPAFRCPALKEILANSLRDEHYRKKNTQLRHKIEMVERNDTGTVDRTAARPHSKSVAIGGRENEQAQRQRTQSQQGLLYILLCIDT